MTRPKCPACGYSPHPADISPDPRDAVVAAADALVGALDEYEFTLDSPHLKSLVASYRALRAALKGLGR